MKNRGLTPFSFSQFRIWFVQLRVVHWVKNLILFIPYILSHPELNLTALSLLFTAFVGFSIVSSAIYVFNDLSDFQSDRVHPTKKQRPIAASSIKKSHAKVVAAILLVLGAYIALTISISFFLYIVAYFCLALAYSAYLKEIVVLDVIILALLYVIRLLAGAVVVDAYLSFWLLTFGSFFFFSLSLIKRYAETQNPENQNSLITNRRGYGIEDRFILLALGIGSSFASILILALYIQDSNTASLYTAPQILFGLVPVFTYWLSKLWLDASRNGNFEDPVTSLIQNRETYAVFLFIIVVVLTAN